MLRALLACCLRLIPRRLRDRYGEEILDTVMARLEATARAQGTLRALVQAGLEVGGLLHAGWRTRLASADRAPRPVAAHPSRHASGKGTMDAIVTDVQFAWRRIRRHPAFSLLAVATLAVGIGAAIAIFSVFNAVLLQPLPFHDPDRLVQISETNPERDWHHAQVAAANYLDWQAASEAFDDIAAHNDWLAEGILHTDGEPSVILGTAVTGNFFRVLGIRPLHGRAFDDNHTWEGPEPAVVLTHRFWANHFGADPAIVDTTIDLNGVARRILGVMPPGFAYPFDQADVWLPTAWSPAYREQVWFRRAHGLRAIGRLADGVSQREAAAELAVIARRLEEAHPETNTEMGTTTTALDTWIVGDVSRPLMILMAVVAFVLLIACVNVSNMLLARISDRRGELWVRCALGASRRRLWREGLVDSLVLAGLGGALGLLLGTLAIKPLLAMSPASLPRQAEVAIDPHVVFFALVVTILSGVFFGSGPAWRGSGAGPRGGKRTTTGRRSRAAAGTLVAAEVALTIPLVIAAGLMVRTLSHLSSVEPGFEPSGVITAKVMLPATRYDNDEKVSTLYRSLQEELRAMPGVQGVAMSTRLPFGNQRWSSDFTTEGWDAETYGVGVRHDEISPGLFRTMGVPLLRGRDFTAADSVDSPIVVIVNQALADRYFPGQNPIGKRVAFDRVAEEGSTWRTIVGVVGNVRRESLAVEELPSFYAPVFQDTSSQVSLLIRSDRDATEIVAAARARLRSLDPTLPLFAVSSLEAAVADAVGRERFLLTLLALAGGIALVLAIAGIFGVVLHATSKRVREIGIRIALGARIESVIAMIVGGGLRPVLVGIAVGLALAAALSRTLESFLYGVQPIDPPTFLGVGLLILAAAALACAIPARWFARRDPMAALRAD